MAKWTKVLGIQNGHRYFEEEGTGKIAVADGSGSTPDRTDDGVLYLDTGSPVILSFGVGESERAAASIPLIKPDGHRCWTGETLDGGFSVARKFGMTVSGPVVPARESEVAVRCLVALNDELRRDREARAREEEISMLENLKHVAIAASTLYHEADARKGIMFTVSPANLTALGDKLNAIGKRKFKVGE